MRIAVNKLVCAGALTVLLVAPTTSACVTVKVYNDSDHELNSTWQAGGCGGINRKWDLSVCTSHDIPPHSSHSHDFDWGKTAQQVLVGFDGWTESKGYWVEVRFTYHKDHKTYRRSYHGIPQTPPSCGAHYSVRYTNADFPKDSHHAAEFRRSHRRENSY